MQCSVSQADVFEPMRDASEASWRWQSRNDRYFQIITEYVVHIQSLAIAFDACLKFPITFPKTKNAQVTRNAGFNFLSNKMSISQCEISQ